ncbi:glycosyltransferase family 2 protein [Methylococcus sp. EFPC2]|uniref:glycosyltransferase family 2 protein n=1 Tax=Methylococcus sp. EFPC2 TaxID=2812648 RepID=UPI001F0840D4|nr:glycosyltransferase family 2 protein [Methylococcus sp. EFPC2]
MHSAKKRVWVVIVNYRAPDLVIDCLRSFSATDWNLRNGYVVVVDNNSGDRSEQMLSDFIARSGLSSWVSLATQERNGGFAYGNNAALRMALGGEAPPDYVMLLNPDTILRSGAIQTLVEFMDGHPQVGVAGSLLETPEGGVDCSAHRVHSPLSELNDGARLGVLSRLLRGYVVSEAPRMKAHACDWVSGASMIIRRPVIEDIGLMDEGFFLYFEEVDYCWRAKNAGWECWYVPESRVMHLEGASTGIKSGAKRRARYWYDSRRYFFIKHYGVAGLFFADGLWALGRLTFLLRQCLHLGGSNRPAEPKRFMFDLLWGDLRFFLQGQLWKLGRPTQGRRV